MEFRSWVLPSDLRHYGQADILPPQFQQELDMRVCEGERQLAERRVDLSDLTSPKRLVPPSPDPQPHV